MNVVSGRGLVVDDRFGLEDSALHGLGVGDVGVGRALADRHADPNPADRDLSRSIDLSSFGQFLDDGRRRDQNVRALASPDLFAQDGSRRKTDVHALTRGLAECLHRGEQAGLHRSRAQHVDVRRTQRGRQERPHKDRE